MASLRAPVLAGFNTALTFIREEQARSELCLVALDQPTIVPNATGMRPVDRVAASVISWLGGGVQPANRSKRGMFDDGAPFWRFKAELGAVEDPEAARSAARGLFLAEVFPALALPSPVDRFFGRLKGPRYNPQRRRTFRLDDWQAVVGAAQACSTNAKIHGAKFWLDEIAALTKPVKGDQDRLDALLCALVGYYWLLREPNASILLLITGYMIAPVTEQVRAKLGAAHSCAVLTSPPRKGVMRSIRTTRRSSGATSSSFQSEPLVGTASAGNEYRAAAVVELVGWDSE